MSRGEGGEGDNLAFLAAETREKHKNETPRLCSEFQRRQPKKIGAGAKFFTFAKHNTLFQHSNSMLIATRGEEVSIDRIRELKVSKYNETSRKGLLHKMFLQRKFPICQQTDLTK